MAAAVSQYGYLTTLRTNWDNYIANDPGGTWASFAGFMVDIAPPSLPHPVVEELLEGIGTALIMMAT